MLFGVDFLHFFASFHSYSFVKCIHCLPQTYSYSALRDFDNINFGNISQKLLHLIMIVYDYMVACPVEMLAHNEANKTQKPP